MTREEAQRVVAQFGNSVDPKDRLRVDEALLVLDGCPPEKAGLLAVNREPNSKSETRVARELRYHVFRLSDHADNQLLLALVICIGRRVGVGSDDFHAFLREHCKAGSIHPNIDREWFSVHEVQRALSRLRARGLVRNGPLALGERSIWRVAPAGERFLTSRLLFDVTDEERRRRANRQRAA